VKRRVRFRAARGWNFESHTRNPRKSGTPPGFISSRTLEIPGSQNPAGDFLNSQFANPNFFVTPQKLIGGVTRQPQNP
jgi:hypothetical protein